MILIVFERLITLQSSCIPFHRLYYWGGLEFVNYNQIPSLNFPIKLMPTDSPLFPSKPVPCPSAITPIFKNLSQPIIIPQSCLQFQNDPGNRQSLWSQDQTCLFMQFLIQQFLDHPLKILSVFVPLKRQSFFNECSSYINQRIVRNQEGSSPKTAQQCKNKYSNIKKTIKRKHKNLPNGEIYDLQEYILEWRSKQEDQNQKLDKKIRKLMRARKRSSKFMYLTQQLMEIQEGPEVSQLHNQILMLISQQQIQMENTIIMKKNTNQ